MRLRHATAYATLPLALLVFWMVAWRFHWVEPVLLPSPSEVLKTALTLHRDGTLWRHAWASTWRVLWGFALTLAIAFPVGAAMGLSGLGRRLLEPLNSLFRYMPFPAFVPLLILWFGLGAATQVAVIFVGTFFQLSVLIQDAFSDIHHEYLDTARSLAFSPIQMFLLVRLPAALPKCYDAVRVGVGWAWTCLIVAEIVGASEGLGYMIVVAQRFLRTPVVFVGIFAIGIVGLALDSALVLLRRLAIPWAADLR